MTPVLSQQHVKNLFPIMTKTLALMWWFTNGWLSLLTVPILLALIAFAAVTVFNAFVQTMAYFKVLGAVWGFFGYALLAFIWPFSLIVPSLLSFAAVTSIPAVIVQNTESRMSEFAYLVFGIVILLGSVLGLQWCHGKTIAWIADRNPQAAYEAGVIGSSPP